MHSTWTKTNSIKNGNGINFCEINFWCRKLCKWANPFCGVMGLVGLYIRQWRHSHVTERAQWALLGAWSASLHVTLPRMYQNIRLNVLPGQMARAKVCLISHLSHPKVCWYPTYRTPKVCRYEEKKAWVTSKDFTGGHAIRSKINVSHWHQFQSHFSIATNTYTIINAWACMHMQW